MRKTTLLLLILTAFQQTVTAQEKKVDNDGKKNTIHFNITNPIIFGSSLIIGYERVLNNRHSFSVNFGTTGFPSLGIINADSIKLVTIRDKKGYNFSVDYRFYLAKENKYAAPRGVYIGPYYSFNTFKNKNDFLVKSSAGSTLNVESELKLNIHTVGFELGYQFVFWDKVSLDLILVGPGVASYSLKASLGSNLSVADKEKLLEKLNDRLAAKFPGYELVIDDGEFKKTGSTNTTSFGYRYMLQIGFRF